MLVTTGIVLYVLVIVLFTRKEKFVNMCLK
nr:MAG TPA: hypothetical protein [Caudoviricetes sp.]DAN84377.1 MAG TPA: hypothetical protein [Caudoviricetes sp.]DAQ56805.1 MAG TPA: hypothetical protein [Caudoviricetes sp.]